MRQGFYSVILLVFILAGAVGAAEIFPYHESFEGATSRWVFAGTDDDASWIQNSGYSSWNPDYYWDTTGPSSAHDRDYYMLADSSVSYPASKLYTMEATFDTSGLLLPELSIRYYMHGDSMGWLGVDIDRGNGWENVFEISQQQHNGYFVPWAKAEIVLPKSSNLKVRINARPNGYYNSDMCIDDIWIYDGVSQQSPRSFSWGAIDPEQRRGRAFPVEIWAMNYQNQLMTTFNQAVELTAWSDENSGQYLPVSPTFTGQFTNGVWAGTVTIDQEFSDIHMIARYADTTSDSGLFSTLVDPLDLDGDGLLDSWERKYFSSVGACQPLVDTDKDGYINKDEYIIGSSPTLKSSHLELTATATGSDQCMVGWNSVAGRIYVVQWTPDLGYIPFTDLSGDIQHPQACITNEAAASGSMRFYRINVRQE